MKNLVKFSIDKAVTIIMIIAAVIVLGFVSLSRTTTELFPNMNLPYAVVLTTNVGATPDEIEAGVTKVLESSLATVANVKNIESTSQEHASLIWLEFIDDTNMDTAMVDIREKIDQTKSNLSKNSSNPIIIKVSPDMMPVMQLSVTKEGISRNELASWYTNEIGPRIERISGVATTSVSGLPDNEVHVYIDDQKMDQLLLHPLFGTLFTKDQDGIFYFNDGTNSMSLKSLVSGFIAGSNISMPSGYVNIDGVDYLLRVGDKLDVESSNDLSAIENLTLFSVDYPVKLELKVKDVAVVSNVDIASKVYSKVNNENAITISIQKQSNYATTEVVSNIKKEIKDITSVDKTVTFITLMDQGEYINQSIMNIVDNLIWGFALAIIVLFIFLKNVKITSAVALAMPLSIMVTFIMIYFSGITLNMISMAGLALGIGMLVDNSIVVVENIYRLRRAGLPRRDAAIKGAVQVAGAIMASTLTTMCVFIPFVFAEGLILSLFTDLALTVCFSLASSLIVSITLIPLITSRIKEEDLEKLKVKEEKKKDSNSVFAKVFKKINIGYEKVLEFVLKFRMLTVGVAILLFVGFGALSLNSGFEMFPASDQGQFTISVEFSKDSTWDKATQTLDDLTQIVISYNDVATASGSYGQSSTMDSLMGSSDNAGSISVMLKDNRKLSTKEIMKQLEVEITNYASGKNYIEETEISSDNGSMMTLGGSSIDYQILGLEVNKLESYALELENKIINTPDILVAVKSIDNGIDKSNDEIKVTVDKDLAAQKMLTVGQVLQVVAGELATDQVSTSIYLDGIETNIIVKDAESNKNYTCVGSDCSDSLKNIKSIVVGSYYGQPVFLDDIATVAIEKGYSKIERVNQSRALTLSVEIKDGYVADKISTKIDQQIKTIQLDKGYSISIAGSSEMLDSAISNMQMVMLLAITLIYVVMASQFQSFKNPFIVMFTIPLAFTGGFIGLLISGNILSLVAIIGLVILAGVIVNNGIVLIEYIDQLKKAGINIHNAIIQACKVRLRPIFMTALTTIGGLFTMALGLGTNGEMMAPLAIVTVFGLGYGTLITLLVIPSLYSLFNRGKKSGNQSEDDIKGKELDYLEKVISGE